MLFSPHNSFWSDTHTITPFRIPHSKDVKNFTARFRNVDVSYLNPTINLGCLKGTPKKKSLNLCTIIFAHSCSTQVNGSGVFRSPGLVAAGLVWTVDVELLKSACRLALAGRARAGICRVGPARLLGGGECAAAAPVPCSLARLVCGVIMTSHEARGTPSVNVYYTAQSIVDCISRRLEFELYTQYFL